MNIELTDDKQGMNNETKLNKRLVYWQKLCDLLMPLHYFTCTSTAHNTNVSYAIAKQKE